MAYQQQLSDIGADPEQVELAYHAASKAGQTSEFSEAIDVKHGEDPDSLLYAAWHYRLRYAATETATHAIAWAWVIPLALLNGLVLWWLFSPLLGDYFMWTPTSSGHNDDLFTYFMLLWAPISAGFTLLYLMLAGSKQWVKFLAVTVGLSAISFYALLPHSQLGDIFKDQYLTLLMAHLPVAALAAVGIFLTVNDSNAAQTGENGSAFLIKSLEVAIMAGLFVIAGGLFIGITFALFAALNVFVSETVGSLLIVGGGGLIPIVAAAVIYDPRIAPAEQSFDDGLSKLIAVLMRIMLPLTLFVLIVYLGFIPFNFEAPYHNRDILIIYNAMLFAIMVLLVGATPTSDTELSPSVTIWLRRGIIAVAALTLLVDIYALSAFGYRTQQDQLTPNRLTFIGWNVSNLAILILLLGKQFRAKKQDWLASAHNAFAIGALIYIGWTLVVILATPWLFGVNQRNLEGVPVEIQNVAYERTGPVLLKCNTSPHIYLLKSGEKRWIKDIPTFESEGFNWHEVNRVSCPSLRALPDGPPIPRDAGPPPQP